MPAAQEEPLELKGLGSLDPNVARLITKLLHKDPRERLTVQKCLQGSFFKSMDDTTRQAGSSAAVVQELRGQSQQLASISSARPRRGPPSTLLPHTALVWFSLNTADGSGAAPRPRPPRRCAGAEAATGGAAPRAQASWRRSASCRSSPTSSWCGATS